MSNDKQNPTVIALDTKSEEQAEESAPKQSRLTRAKAFVKDHKTPTLAVAGLVGLVGVSAWVGRKTAPEIDSPTYTFDPVEVEIVEFTPSDYEVADEN